jgi:hypothetical protein
MQRIRSTGHGRGRHLLLDRRALEPALDPLGIGHPGEAAEGIEQHDDHRLVEQPGLHHQALAGLVDEAGLGNADLPVGAAHQRVGVVELARTAVEDTT